MRWSEFRDALSRYAQLDRQRRSQLLFRGQADVAWALATTLERHRHFADDTQRQNYVTQLLAEFEREAILLPQVHSPLPKGEALELLARHHGLPSPLLDWTLSPYIAAYFAFQGNGATDACVWVFDRARLLDPSVSASAFDIIDDRSLLQFNRRALQQRGVFLRINTASRPLESLLGAALTRFELHAADRSLALAELDAMNINATTLFDDLDGVAQTVRDRMS